MALNITEAIAAQALIRWVSTLTLWERTDPNPDLDEADERLLEHVRVLAKSAECLAVIAAVVFVLCDQVREEAQRIGARS